MRISIDLINATGVEARRAPHYAVNLVSLREKQLGKVRTVLPGDACNERALAH
jgi:hypothetical protein